MFCNKCGAQLPDGTNFCKYCGASLSSAPAEFSNYAEPYMVQPPVQPQPTAPQPMQAPMAPPPNNYDEQKKSSTGYIVIAVVAVILIAAVIVTAILLFGNKDSDSEDSKSTTTSSATTLIAGGSAQQTTGTTTEPSSNTSEPSSETSANSTSAPVTDPNTQPTPQPNPQPNPQPQVDLDGAELTAQMYLEYVDMRDLPSACLYECLLSSDFEYAFEQVLFEEYEGYYGYLTRDELYSYISDDIGYTVSDVEDIFDILIEEAYYEIEFADEISIVSSKPISKSESTKFINATKNQMDRLREYGLYSEDYDFSGYNSFAQVNAELDYSDGSTTDVSLLLGNSNGYWDVIYVEINGEPGCLFSLDYIEYCVS